MKYILCVCLLFAGLAMGGPASEPHWVNTTPGTSGLYIESVQPIILDAGTETSEQTKEMVMRWDVWLVVVAFAVTWLVWNLRLWARWYRQCWLEGKEECVPVWPLSDTLFDLDGEGLCVNTIASLAIMAGCCALAGILVYFTGVKVLLMASVWSAIGWVAVWIIVKAARIHRRLYKMKGKLKEGCALFCGVMGHKENNEG